MKYGGVFLFIIFQMLASLSHAYHHVDLKPMMLGVAVERDSAFKTSRDMLFGTNSGITIVNVSNSTIPLTGIYIQTLYSSDGLLSANYGSAVGAMWSTVTLGTSSPTNTTKIGANFLYNMIMNYNYQSFISNGSGAPETPGSSTSGTPWLVFLGVVKGTPVTPTANVSDTPGTGNDLVYIEVVPPYTTSFSQQICVSCNDATQTCTTSGAACYGGHTTSSTQQDVPCNLDGSTGCAAGVYPPPLR